MAKLTPKDTYLIRHKHNLGKTPTQIASELHQEPEAIRRVLMEMGLEPNTLLAPKVARVRQSKPKNIGAFHCKVKDPAPIGNPEGENPVRIAEFILRNRLSTLRGIEMLDGAPSTLDRKMIEANTILFRQGKGPKEQLGRNPAWHVTKIQT